MEQDPYFHLRDVSKKLALVGTLIGAAGGGALISRSVFPEYHVFYPNSPSVLVVNDLSETPVVGLGLPPTPTREDPTQQEDGFIVYDNCFTINNLYSPDLLRQSTCVQVKHESLVREWIKHQPQSMHADMQTAAASDEAHDAPNQTDFDPVSFCRKSVQQGTTYSEYSDEKNNIEGCYDIFDVNPETINPLKTRSEHKTYPIFSSSLSSSTYENQESWLTLVDDAPSPSEWNP